jgi:hypothetical protein
MKDEIIYTNDYALIVSDQEIEKYNFVFNPIYKTLYQWIKNADMQFDRIDAKKVIAHRSLTDAPILKGVALLPEFEDDDFLNTEIQIVGDNKTRSVSGFLKKYGKETYKYTEEDLRKVIEASRDIRYVTYSEDELIQSLQPKRPKYFECEIEDSFLLKNRKGGNTIMAKPKTIINSQGQTELVGTYGGGEQ